MKKLVLSKDLKTSLGFGLIGLFGGMATAMWQLPGLPDEVVKVTNKEKIVIAAAIQVMVTTFVLSFIGIKLAKKTNLKLHVVNSVKDVISMLLVTGLTSLLIFVGFDKLIFAPYLGDYINTPFRLSLAELSASVLYGGIIEEVMLRLFFMSLIVFFTYKVFSKNKQTTEIPNWIYITAIIVGAVVFGAGHLPATQTLFGLSLPIVTRCFLLNGLGGVLFGYYYWKKGLTMAMASHLTAHIFRLFLWMPLFFKG